MKIMLIGNYVPDEQESMLRYADLLCDGLRDAGHDVLLVAPQRYMTHSGPTGLRKWVGYIDKYLLAPAQLAQAARTVDAVHVCDHSNAVYIPLRPRVPYTVTCHDLLAVRGALGEVADCPATITGRMLQHAIGRGLGRADAVACVSSYTMRDFQRLLPAFCGQVDLVPNALNYSYQKLNDIETNGRFPAEIDRWNVGSAYVLLVGSSHRRKNRETAIRAMAEIATQWNGKLVFAGQPLSTEQRNLADGLNIAHRIVEINKPSNALLEMLYNHASALLFPSRFEGFGWPIIEAQACGCPVICSDREPFHEVSDNCAVFCDADDHAAFGRAILDMERRSALREDLVSRGLKNAKRHSRRAMSERIAGLLSQAIAQRK